MKAAKGINGDKVKEILSQLGNYFNNDSAWQKDGSLEIDFEKFFSSCIFRLEGSSDSDRIDWKLLTFFALFTCRQRGSMVIHRIAEKIARESITEKAQMHQDPFI